MGPNRKSALRRTHDFDETDRKILAILETDARRPTAEIARSIGLTGPATAERIARMRDKGVIKAFTVKLDAGQLGLNVAAFVEFEPNSHADGPGIACVVGHAAVRSCYKVTGPALFILIVSTRDGAELHNVLLDFSKHGTTKTSVILSAELADLPFFGPRPDDPIAALLKRSA